MKTVNTSNSGDISRRKSEGFIRRAGKRTLTTAQLVLNRLLHGDEKKQKDEATVELKRRSKAA